MPAPREPLTPKHRIASPLSPSTAPNTSRPFQPTATCVDHAFKPAVKRPVKPTQSYSKTATLAKDKQHRPRPPRIATQSQNQPAHARLSHPPAQPGRLAVFIHAESDVDVNQREGHRDQAPSTVWGVSSAPNSDDTWEPLRCWLELLDADASITLSREQVDSLRSLLEDMGGAARRCNELSSRISQLDSEVYFHTNELGHARKEAKEDAEKREREVAVAHDDLKRKIGELENACVDAEAEATAKSDAHDLLVQRVGKLQDQLKHALANGKYDGEQVIRLLAKVQLLEEREKDLQQHLEALLGASQSHDRELAEAKDAVAEVAAERDKALEQWRQAVADGLQIGAERDGLRVHLLESQEQCVLVTKSLRVLRAQVAQSGEALNQTHAPKVATPVSTRLDAEPEPLTTTTPSPIPSPPTSSILCLPQRSLWPSSAHLPTPPSTPTFPTSKPQRTHRPPKPKPKPTSVPGNNLLAGIQALLESFDGTQLQPRLLSLITAYRLAVAQGGHPAGLLLEDVMRAKAAGGGRKALRAAVTAELLRRAQ